ncbi:unnamed protein product [Candidula unifasciata]|uniref:Uncharacterized protein n=1 Tax=Candidula unifasciata TaxID=100452 RepID=A0A8S4AG76_9EUPU|nr:unnamed protein product [Candidula unifasciata]
MNSAPGVSPSALTQVSAPAELGLTQASPIFACGTTVGLQIPRSSQIATAAPVLGIPRSTIPCNPSILTLANQVPVPGYGYLPLPPAGATDRAIPPAAYADFGANSIVSAAPLALPAPHSVTPRNDNGTSALTLATASHHLQRDTLARAAGQTLGATVLGSYGSYPTTTSPLNRAFSTNSPPNPMDMFSQESVTYIHHNTATTPQPGAFTAFGLGRTAGMTESLPLP